MRETRALTRPAATGH